jgi:hypothetical protein
MVDDAESVVRAVIKAARGGDMVAAKLIFDRVYPVRRSHPTPFSLPGDGSTSDSLELLGAVVKAMADGTLTAEEASHAASVIEVRRKAISDARGECGGPPETGMIIRREDLARKLEERGLPPMIFGIDVPTLELEPEKRQPETAGQDG